MTDALTLQGQIPIVPFPRSSAVDIMAMLQEATSQYEMLSILGRASANDWDGVSDRDWSAWLRRHSNEMGFYDVVGVALVHWAVQVAKPWLQTLRRYPAGHHKRAAIWSDPKVVPAMLVLEHCRAYTRDYKAPTVTAARQGRMMEDIIDETNGTMEQEGADLAYAAWKTYGEATTEALDTVARRPRTKTASNEWIALVGHPNASASARARAVAELATRRQLHLALGRPGLFADAATRAAAAPAAGTEETVARALLAETSPAEFATLIAQRSVRGAYAEIGQLLSLGSPAQKAAICVSATEYARWCEMVPTPYREAVMAVASSVTPEETPAPRKRARRL